MVDIYVLNGLCIVCCMAFVIAFNVFVDVFLYVLWCVHSYIMSKYYISFSTGQTSAPQSVSNAAIQPPRSMSLRCNAYQGLILL